MGWSELILVAIVALIVVGPKDLPIMFRAMGRIFAKIRRIGNEFSDAMYDAAEASGAEAIAKDLQGINDPNFFGADTLKQAGEKFEQWEPGFSKKAIGSETAKLTQKRAEAARKIREKAAEVATERRKRETKSSAGAGGAPAKGKRAQKSSPKSARAKPSAPKKGVQKGGQKGARKTTAPKKPSDKTA